jgi:hypothetical protein
MVFDHNRTVFIGSLGLFGHFFLVIPYFFLMFLSLRIPFCSLACNFGSSFISIIKFDYYKNIV